MVRAETYGLGMHIDVNGFPMFAFPARATAELEMPCQHYVTAEDNTLSVQLDESPPGATGTVTVIWVRPGDARFTLREFSITVLPDGRTRVESSSMDDPKREYEADGATELEDTFRNPERNWPRWRWEAAAPVGESRGAEDTAASELLAEHQRLHAMLAGGRSQEIRGRFSVKSKEFASAYLVDDSTAERMLNILPVLESDENSVLPFRDPSPLLCLLPCRRVATLKNEDGTGLIGVRDGELGAIRELRLWWARLESGWTIVR